MTLKNLQANHAVHCLSCPIYYPSANICGKAKGAKPVYAAECQFNPGANNPMNSFLPAYTEASVEIKCHYVYDGWPRHKLLIPDLSEA